MGDWHICRYCGQRGSSDHVSIKYGVRHYAHPICYLDAGRSLADLSSWQIEQLPALILAKRGLLAEAERLIAKAEGR